MRANLWSPVLVALSFLSLTVQAAPPDTTPGTRITIRLDEAQGELPDAEKMVELLEVPSDGEHLVQAKRHKSPGQQELTLDLWGDTLPQAEIPTKLRETFPALASADIQVTSIDPKERPKLEGEGRLERELRGEKGTVKKVVKTIQKE